MSTKYIIKTFVYLALVLSFSKLIGQKCDPPASDSCHLANILCSLDEVNGYSCKNTDKRNLGTCNALCPDGGIPNNISWWGFVTNGGKVCISITFSNCSVVNDGVQMGIYGDCDCVDTVACVFSCLKANSTYQICADLVPCKTYYLFVDGCSGDVCDFTLATDKGGPPVLPPITDIVGPNDICAGACNVFYEIIQDSTPCRPAYTWTLDGVVLPLKDKKIPLDLMVEGTYILCASAVIGNSKSISLCDQVGPICDTIRVTKAPVRRDNRTICFENQPYKWVNLMIDTSGSYTQQFTENCCGIDSIINFTLLPKVVSPNIYFLGCQGDSYREAKTNQTFTTCQNGTEIFLSKSTDQYKCDSSYFLFATFLNINANLKEYCFNGKILLEATVTDNTCSVNSYSTQGYTYKWYRKSDVTKSSIGNTSIIEVINKDDYCVEITITGNLDSQTKSCSFNFCENINEDQFRQNMVCPKGNLQVCRNDVVNYTTDTIFPPNVRHIWTITNGTIQTPNAINTPNIVVKWDYDPGTGIPYIGKLCYHYESDCPPSPECCIEINVQPYPTPNAGPDKSVCGLVETISGTFSVGGTWTQISGPSATITPNNIATPTVTSSAFGKGIFVLTESRFGCTSYDTMSINFYETPNHSAPTFKCEPDQLSYKKEFNISGGTPPYTLIKGNGAIDVNNKYTSGLIPNTVNDTVTIRDINGCEFTYIVSHECLCSNSIGTISTLIQNVCEDGLINVIYNKNGEILDPAPNKDTVIFFIYTNINDPLGSIIKFINTNSFGYDPLFTFGTTYYIGARLGRSNGMGGIDLSKGCLKLATGTPFVFYKIPQPLAGRDTSLCNDNYNLTGFQSISGTTITWFEKDNKLVSFTNSSSPTTNVVIRAGYGTYTFRIRESNQNGLCVREDEVIVTFNQIPEILNINPFCAELGSGGNNVGKYLVKADIRSGKPPYNLKIPPSTTNGMINGSIWMSDSIKSLDNYTIQIIDANGCLSNIISDTYNCNCGPVNAGILDSTVIRSCVDTCVRIRELLPVTIDPIEDAVMYVLHNTFYNDTLNTLDTFYSINDVICFDPKKMQVQKPVYITRVVGDDKAPKNGVVDFADICRRASNNMTIIFEPYPSPNAGADAKVCGSVYSLSGTLTDGSPTWKFISGPGMPSILNPNSTSTLVTVPIKGIYIFELEGANYNCKRTDRVSIEFNDAPEFIDGTVRFICDSVAENYRVVVDSRNGDQPSWNVTGKYNNGTLNLPGQFVPVTTSWQSGWIPNGNTFTLNIKDKNDCATDVLDSVHVCACLTKIGNLDLTPILLCSDGQAQALYNGSQSVLDPNDIIRYVLYDGLPGDPINGTIIASNSTGQFVFDPSKMVLGKTYYIAVFAGNRDPISGGINFKDRCLQNTPGVPVTWYKYPEAKITGATLLTCTITSITLDASTSISGSGDPLTYSWNTTSTTSSISTSLPGTFTVTVTDSKSKCTNTATFVVNRMVDLPKVIIDTPLKFTCDRTQVDIFGTKSDQGVNYQAFWKGNSIISGGNSYNAKVGAPGRYTLVVENKQTNCRDSLDVMVGTDYALPTAKITQTGTLGCVVKQIDLSGSQSVGGSGNISSYSWTGPNIIGSNNTSSIKVGSPGGRYILTVKDASNGCIDTDTIDIVEEGNPIALIRSTPHNPNCFGQSNGEINIDEVLDKNGLPISGLQYSLNGGPFVSTTKFNNLRPGTYTITVRDSNGCILSSQSLIVEPQPLTISVKSVTADQGSFVSLDTLLLGLFGGTDSLGFYRDTTWFSLQDSNYLFNLNILADSTKSFVVTGIDSAGCEVSAIVTINVRIIKDVWWPTVINPNSTLAENARFNLYGKRVRNIRLLQIFSRWGELVYSAENLLDANKAKGLGWDGIFLGQYALPGVYAFYAEVQFENSADKEIVKGDFTLLR